MFKTDELKKRMISAMDALHKEFVGLRTSRASTAMLEPIMVDAYGSRVPMTQVATISAPEARLLVVQIWDRELSKTVEKAIRESGLGLNPIGEGQVIRVPLPELSQERRQEMSKVASKYAEQARIAVRNVRRDGMDDLKKLEKDGHISEDEHRRYASDVQNLTDEFIKKIDQALAEKEKDIMQV